MCNSIEIGFYKTLSSFWPIISNNNNNNALTAYMLYAIWSAKKGFIAIPIVCIWLSIVRHVSMVPTWNLVTLHYWHGSIPGSNFTSIGWTHYELQLNEVEN